VNTKESRIEIHLFKGGFLGALGDNHLITLTHFSGTANLSQADGWEADFSGDATSLKVIDPWGNPSERKEVEDTMLGPTQLDVNNFPSIRLRSVSFDPTDQDTAWSLLAEVELHGVARKVQFSLDCHQIGDKLQIRGRKMFKLTDFNIQPFSTAFGAVKVKNDFLVTYNIVLERVH
jgi:polyisoprenoid-binding protein YceI